MTASLQKLATSWAVIDRPYSGEKTIIALVVVVLVHLAVNLVHGSAHTAAGVELGPAGLAFVIIVILIGPMAGLALMLVNRQFGALVIMLTMLAALVFGLVNHFIIPGADRVDYVHGDSHALFETTAVMLAIIELAAVALAIAYRRSAISRIS